MTFKEFSEFIVAKVNDDLDGFGVIEFRSTGQLTFDFRLKDFPDMTYELYWGMGPWFVRFHKMIDYIHRPLLESMSNFAKRIAQEMDNLATEQPK